MQGVSVVIATGDYGVAGFPVSASQPAGQCIGPNKNAFTREDVGTLIYNPVC